MFKCQYYGNEKTRCIMQRADDSDGLSQSLLELPQIAQKRHPGGSYYAHFNECDAQDDAP